MLDFLANPWVQLILWAAAIVILQFHLRGTDRIWNFIAAGFIIYAIRVGFKVLPFYSKADAWPQVMRYALGIIGGLLLMYGFIEYIYRELQPYEEMQK